MNQSKEILEEVDEMGLWVLVTVLVLVTLTVFGESGPLGVPCCQGIWLHTVLFEDISLSRLKTWVLEDRKLDSSAVKGGFSLTELQFLIRLLIAASINCDAVECSCYDEHSIKRLKQNHQKKGKGKKAITGSQEVGRCPWRPPSPAPAPAGPPRATCPGPRLGGFQIPPGREGGCPTPLASCPEFCSPAERCFGKAQISYALYFNAAQLWKHQLQIK